jgi:tRNA dimethylallyltransferase
VAERPPILILIAGQTATGKSALATRLARKFDGEVIGADSIQVYRGLDAASDKPSLATREEIPHHLIDIEDPDRDFSAGDYVRHASAAIAEVAARGKRPILAGGTGLYIRALLRGLADMPRRQPVLRERLRRWEAKRGDGALHGMLEELDPATAARLSLRDRQRILRSVEVALATGRPLSVHIADQPFGKDLYPCVKIGLRLPWEALRRKIDSRVERFFQEGLVEEVRALLDGGVPRTANCFKALGYREVLQHHEEGLELEKTVALVKANTRRYAKRQLTWFRREPGIRWFEPGENSAEWFAEVEAYVAERLRAEESRDGERKPR